MLELEILWCYDDDDSRLLSLIRSRICRLWYKEIHPTYYRSFMVHKYNVALGPWVVLNIPNRAGCYEILWCHTMNSYLEKVPSHDFPWWIGQSMTPKSAQPKAQADNDRLNFAGKSIKRYCWKFYSTGYQSHYSSDCRPNTTHEHLIDLGVVPGSFILYARTLHQYEKLEGSSTPHYRVALLTLN